MSAEWVEVGHGRWRLVNPENLEDEAPVSPNRSKLYGMPEICVKPSVAHIARTLPRSRRADGSPTVKGADGYTKEGFPIIESQRTVERVIKQNPELHLRRDDAVDATIERMIQEVPD